MTERLSIRCRNCPGSPLIAVRVWVVGGARAEDKPGQALVASRALVEGTKRRSWLELAEFTERLGIDLDGFTSLDVHGVAIDSLSRDLDRTLDLAAEVLLEATFPAERCRWVALQARGEWRSQLDQPEARTAWAFGKQIYGSNPAGRSLYGSEMALAKLGARDSAAYHHLALSRRVIVAVAGAIDEDAVMEGVEMRLGATLAGQAAPDPETAPPKGRGGARRIVTLDQSRQAHLFLGALTVDRRDPDHPALEAASTILGGGAGLAGRIPRRVRENAGLAYAVHVSAVAGAGLERGYFVVYAGCLPGSLAEVELLVREEIKRFAQSGPTSDELESAISYLVRRDPFARQTASQWAGLLASSELYQLPLDRPDWRREQLMALDRERVMEAARRYFAPGLLRTTVGRPAGTPAPPPGMMGGT